LHYLNGRDQNVLTHRLQEKVVQYLGYRTASKGSAVESLMKEYFFHARTISGFCADSFSDPGSEPGSASVREAVEFESLAEIVELFLEGLEAGHAVGSRQGAAIQEAIPKVSATLSYPALRNLVLDLFEPREGLYLCLNRMYELGVLEILFPEFDTIRARVIRDFYHKYTVDEHSLQAIKCIEDLAVDPEDSRFGILLDDVDEPRVLTLALLLHDVGKGRGGKHVDSGARMAARALRRFRMKKDLLDIVVFLIRNHLAMSAVMFRRNLDDRGVIARFADLAGDVNHLRLLTLLTYADIKAVAPGTLNAWKKDRLWQLYVATYNHLTLGFGEKRISEADISGRLVRDLPEGLDASGFEAFLEGFPVRYLSTTSAPEVYRHYELGLELGSGVPVRFTLEDLGSHYALCVVTKDTSRLFARIVGLLSYFGMNIFRGCGFSNQRGVVLDFFEFTDTADAFKLNSDERHRFEELLTQVVTDDIQVEDLLERKEGSLIFKSAAPHFRASVSFDEELSPDCSIMEIIAPDSIGLLHRIANEISAMGCNIELILISTEGGRAVDVFYLRHDGAKLSLEMRQELSQRIPKSIG